MEWVILMKPDKKEKRLAKDLDKIDREEEFIPWKGASSHDLQKVEVIGEIILPRNKFSLEEAHAWCESNGYKHNQVIKTMRNYIFTQ
jgi:hypothetical protein